LEFELDELMSGCYREKVFSQQQLLNVLTTTTTTTTTTTRCIA